MGNTQDYRWFAARCLEIARVSTDSQTQVLMLQMAQVWHRLADIADGLSAAESSIDGADRGEAAKSAGHDPPG